MMKNLTQFRRLALALSCALAFADAAQAQFFTASKGDLLLGFRKTSGGTYELVVNIGSVTNFTSLAAGTTVSVGNFTPTQLSNAFSSYGNLQWSVGGAFSGSSPWSGYPS